MTAAFGADAVRGEKAKVVGAIRPWSTEEARANSVRGQYVAGEMWGVWSGLIASRLAPTVDLRCSHNPCGSELARDKAITFNIDADG